MSAPPSCIWVRPVCIGVPREESTNLGVAYIFDHGPSILSSVCLFVHDSYISAISEVITNPSDNCDGMAKKEMGESRLDILDSEINREWQSLFWRHDNTPNLEPFWIESVTSSNLLSSM